MAQSPVIFSTDIQGKVKDVSWTPIRPGYTPRGGDNKDIICSGWLLGDKDLRQQVKDILANDAIESVDIYWTRYVFSKERNTPADVVAALYSTGRGRGVLNDEGWDILNEALPQLVDPENNRDDVIY